MSQPSETAYSKTPRRLPKRLESLLSPGALLIALGAFFLLTRLFDMDPFTLPILALGLIAIGILRRESGWFIPGSILAGLGLGSYVAEAPFASMMSDDVQGGAFLLALSLGWWSVPLLCSIFGDAPHTWAFIPAAVLSVLGVLILSAQAEPVLALLSYTWPLMLAGFGVWLLLERRG